MATQNELEQIITIGKLEKNFQILNFKARMRTLTSNELWKIMQETSGYDELTKFIGTKVKTLAYSIIALNNKPIQYCTKDEDDTSNDEKLYRQNEELIGKWQIGVTNLFYDKYIELRGEQQDFLEQSQISLEKSGVDKNGKSEKMSG